MYIRSRRDRNTVFLSSLSDNLNKEIMPACARREYKTAATLGECFDNGALRGDLDYKYKKSFIKLEVGAWCCTWDRSPLPAVPGLRWYGVSDRSAFWVCVCVWVWAGGIRYILRRPVQEDYDPWGGLRQRRCPKGEFDNDLPRKFS